ncbi:MAG: response regulator transcription factor [Bacteroidota bacterium]
MKKNRIALVDDHQLFRDGLSAIVNGFSEFQVILEADNGKDFIAKLRDDNLPDIALLDINMKEMDGFQTAEWLKAYHPNIKVLALSMYEDENSVIRMMRLGARGYILKDIRKQELHQALCLLAEKGYYYTELVTGKLIHAINNIDRESSQDTLKDLIALNQKEIEFLKLVCSELTYKEIAEKMCLSPHTIDGYRDNLFQKLNVHSRVGLVLYAIKRRIFRVDQ